MIKKIIIMAVVGGIVVLAFKPSVFPWLDRTISHMQKEKIIVTSKPLKEADSQDALFSIKELKTDLGDTIWFVPTSIPVVSFGLVFERSGGQNEPTDLPGLTSLLTDLLQEGAGPYDGQAFGKLLIEKNIDLRDCPSI
ncbi:MAG: hypothetical protein NTX76_01860 [Alphaproteobacteria bacterium]|nr:hypothetical protein [Alphaproteobacteria bacterium]